MAQLADIFAIEVCAYAVLSNHYHVVLYVDQEQALDWSDDTVIERWTQLFSLPVLVARYQQGLCKSKAEVEQAHAIIETWRERLYDISWYMRCLNEHLARMANAEDDCTGRFWEGRFKSQALLDEAGLLTCMAYVDLNPIRAGIAKTPEQSEYTSIQDRIGAIQADTGTPNSLKAFHTANRQDKDPSLPFMLQDYIELVDWTGRAVREDKRGSITNDLPPILERLNIAPAQWLGLMQPNGNVFGRAIGRIDKLRNHAKNMGQRWCHGLRSSTALFPT